MTGLIILVVAMVGYWLFFSIIGAITRTNIKGRFGSSLGSPELIDSLVKQAYKKVKEIGPIDEKIKSKFQNFKNKLNSSNTSNDNLDALEKLFNLKEKGVISEEEFEIQKKKILR